MELVNKTPFRAERFLLQDREGRDLLAVILKCTYSLKSRAEIRPAEEQVPVQMEDGFYGRPGESSVRYESDLVPFKPGTDVVLIGHAYAPKPMIRRIDVTVRVGSLERTCRVNGNRRWQKTFGFLGISEPEPLEKIPLVYERSFGGQDLSSPEVKDHERENRNPVGCGLWARKSRLEPEEVALPNIEDPANPIKGRQDRPRPAGFGFIGRHWQPRLAYAGTYDQNWAEKRSPLLPLDFDERYFHGAHPDLVFNGHLQGGEPVEIIHASPQGSLRFTLPRMRPQVALISTAMEWTYAEPRFDTLILEPDESRIIAVWRASKLLDNLLHKVAFIRVTADG
jgi:hypothetical protein